MNDVLEIVLELERVGGTLSLSGDRVEYTIPRESHKAHDLLLELRSQRDTVAEVLRSRRKQKAQDLLPASSDRMSRFGHEYVWLFPYIGRKVRTPRGSGTLLQVFADRATVVLDCQLLECALFEPTEIDPVSWEVPE
jgi:hypothetical protein